MFKSELILAICIARDKIEYWRKDYNSQQTIAILINNGPNKGEKICERLKMMYNQAI